MPANQIDVGSGAANYQGDPDVERLALTPEDLAAFATYNAANPGNPAAPVGRIFSRNQPFLNLSSSEHKGVDVGFRYVLPRALGPIGMNSDGATCRARSRCWRPRPAP